MRPHVKIDIDNTVSYYDHEGFVGTWSPTVGFVYCTSILSRRDEMELMLFHPLPVSSPSPILEETTQYQLEEMWFNQTYLPVEEN